MEPKLGHDVLWVLSLLKQPRFMWTELEIRALEAIEFLLAKQPDTTGAEHDRR